MPTLKQLTIIPADPGMATFVLQGPDTLDELRMQVGGYIQVIPVFKEYNGRHCTAYCNEDGQSLGLPLNREATRLWYAQFGPRALRGQPLLYGPVVIVQSLDRTHNAAAQPTHTHDHHHPK